MGAARGHPSRADWIARCAREVFDEKKPTLTLVYLPHLDYNLQRLGPDAPARSPRTCARSTQSRASSSITSRARGARVVVLRNTASPTVCGAIHINRALREAGLLAVRDELGPRSSTPAARDAFAVADHQIAHVYVRDNRERDRRSAHARCEALAGVELVLDDEGKRAHGLDHPRSGELVAISKSDRWFSYYFWLDDALAPDFARTVDIHRKPGYDPVELFVDPKLMFPALKIGKKLRRRRSAFACCSMSFRSTPAWSKARTAVPRATRTDRCSSAASLRFGTVGGDDRSHRREGIAASASFRLALRRRVHRQN